MSDGRKINHPDLFELAAYAEGSLGVELSAAIGRHVSDCAICQLELKRMERFESIDTDEELLAASGWESAEADLEAGYRDKVRPVMAAPDSVGKVRFSWRWVAPLAAAAIVVAIVIPGRFTGPGGYSDEQSPLRGGEETAVFIEPVAPLGQFTGPPEFFAWSASKPFDSFSLQVFSLKLEPVFEQTGIRSEKRSVSDSLLAALRPGQVYLWTVTGHTGLESEAASAPARFEILEFPPEK
ncbi:MAG: hypothetical protein KAH56_13985 [Candidatus Krumholzibacteria bacterium]|nr:hypothetical protein [Candidatus Krumholzibacteria bacterium]